MPVDWSSILKRNPRFLQSLRENIQTFSAKIGMQSVDVVIKVIITLFYFALSMAFLKYLHDHLLLLQK